MIQVYRTHLIEGLQGVVGSSFVHALFQTAEEFDVILPRTLPALDIEFLGGYHPT